jgi:hypothetical protein
VPARRDGTDPRDHRHDRDHLHNPDVRALSSA